MKNIFKSENYKNFLQFQISDNHLVGLAILSTEKYASNEMDMDKIILMYVYYLATDLCLFNE